MTRRDAAAFSIRCGNLFGRGRRRVVRHEFHKRMSGAVVKPLDEQPRLRLS